MHERGIKTITLTYYLEVITRNSSRNSQIKPRNRTLHHEHRSPIKILLPCSLRRLSSSSLRLLPCIGWTLLLNPSHLISSPPYPQLSRISRAPHNTFLARASCGHNPPLSPVWFGFFLPPAAVCARCGVRRARFILGHCQSNQGRPCPVHAHLKGRA